MARKLKDSGIPWIGTIPEEWDNCRFKSRFTTRKGLSITKADLTESGIPVISYGQIHSKHNNGTTVTPDITKYVPRKYLQSDPIALVHKGDFIFADTSEDITGCGNCVYIDYDGKIFGGYHSIIASGGDNNKYFAYLFLTDAWRGQIRCNATGIKVFSISQGMLANTKLLLPPVAEQEKIAAYLDKKCGEIDELIEVEQQMISDLESYRQAVITEAVTKGLNPEVSQKLSSIRGIEKIPINWNEVNLLKVIYFRARLGWRGLKAEEYVDEGYPFLSAFNIVNNQLIWNNLNFINKQRYDESPEIKLSLHDILIVKDGAIGKCARVQDMPLGESTVNSSLGVITVSETLYYSYLFYLFLSIPFQDNVLFLKNGMGVPHLTQENLKSVRIPLPHIEEQKEIADYLDAKCAEIDSLIKVKQEKIGTLKEYRQSLIFEAVTGKIEL